MPTVTVRFAALEDVEELGVLFDSYRQFYRQLPDLALATRFIRERMQKDESRILLAQDSSAAPVGFCQLYPSFCSLIAAPIYILSDLFVSPGARNAGAGRALMQAAYQHGREGGFARLDLTTARSNLPAQSLYESLGWVRDEVFLAYNKPVLA